jgi:hypothetical protein
VVVVVVAEDEDEDEEDVKDEDGEGEEDEGEGLSAEAGISSMVPSVMVPPQIACDAHVAYVQILATSPGLILYLVFGSKCGRQK